MSLFSCNIDQKDRINRTIIGLIIFVGALLDLSTLFFMLVGVVMMIQGALGWCSLPYLIEKIKNLK